MAGRACADTGAGMMVIGRDTLRDREENIKRHGREVRWIPGADKVAFKFGDSKTLKGIGMVEYPLGLAGELEGVIRVFYSVT